MAPTFIRVTFFNFPSTYPRPSSLLRKSRPSVEIEKGSSDIPRSKRHALLRDLKKILEKEAPALELCLLYLLGKYELQDPDAALNGSGTVPGWDDDETSLIPGLPDDSGLPIPLLRDHYALPKNRHTQGIFGPNGKLIILSRRASPLSAPGSRPDSPSGSISNFSSVVPSTSGTLLDAMWGLSRLAVDREYIKRDFADVGRPRRANFTDSLILKPYIRPRTRDTRPAPPLTNVDIVSTADYGGIIDLDLTSAFDLAPSTSVAQFAAHALELCRPLRPDIAQVWNVILSVISKAVEPAEVTGPLMTNRPINPKLRAIIQRDLMQVIGAV
ncbi:hypothetical protein DL93DRAFT_246294 [Clavulina sp. PMI_390]|nr:hypothetical protein DL93DRAFT_246294 [Clavulina sp. PMI_390]